MDTDHQTSHCRGDVVYIDTVWPAQTAFNASATFDLGAHVGIKGLLPTTLLWPNAKRLKFSNFF